jgi:hypothetical protein
MSTVRELICLKEQFDEAAATIWLTTTDMGFALTDEQHMLLCPKDVREGKVIDRYLAPAISRFAIDIQTEEKCQPTSDRAADEIRREIVNLHQRWGKVREESPDDDIRERARGSATETQGFTRIVRRKNLTWESDSIARVAYDPAHSGLQRTRHGRKAFFVSRANSIHKEWTRVSPSNQILVVVATTRVSRRVET